MDYFKLLRPALVISAVLLHAGASLAQTSVRFSLEGRLEGPAAIFLVPQDKGYYQQQGLEVSIDEATTPLEPITRVAAGTYDLGVADINALIRYRDQQQTSGVKAIFMVYDVPPFSLVARKSRGITGPKQLEGKRIAGGAGATDSEWPLFAKLNDIDLSKVKVESVGIPVRAPMLAAGELDAALGYSYRLYVDLKDRGVPMDDILLLRMSDYGLKLYGSAIIVNQKFAAEKPEAVSSFLRALLSGLKDSIRNPGSAVESLLRRDDGTRMSVELDRLRMAIRDNIITGATRTKGVGSLDPVRFDQAVEQIAMVYPFKAKPKAEDIFDPSFLPSVTDRRID